MRNVWKTKKKHFKLKPLSSMHNSQCIHTGLVYLVIVICHNISSTNYIIYLNTRKVITLPPTKILERHHLKSTALVGLEFCCFFWGGRQALATERRGSSQSRKGQVLSLLTELVFFNIPIRMEIEDWQRTLVTRFRRGETWTWKRTLWAQGRDPSQSFSKRTRKPRQILFFKKRAVRCASIKHMMLHFGSRIATIFVKSDRT